MYSDKLGSHTPSRAEEIAATKYVPRAVRKAAGQAAADQYAGTEEPQTPRHLPASSSPPAEVKHWWEVRADQATGGTAAPADNKQAEATPARSLAERAAEAARTFRDRFTVRHNRVVVQATGNGDEPIEGNNAERGREEQARQPRAAGNDRDLPPPTGGRGRRLGSPDDESRAQRALEAFVAAHPNLAERFQGVSARNFLRAFGDNPDAKLVDRLSAVPGFREILDTDPGQARHLYTDPPQIFGRHGVDSVQLRSRELEADVSALQWGDAKRMLLSSEIDPEYLGYKTQIRPIEEGMTPQQIADSVPIRFDELRRAVVTRFTETAIIADSDEARDHVRLVEVLDRRGQLRVAQARTYLAPNAEMSRPERLVRVPEELALEARFAELNDRLGIGPEYHGIHQGPDGNYYLVTDIIPTHAFQEMPVNFRSLRDLETIMSRLKAAGREQVTKLDLARDDEGGIVIGRPEMTLRAQPELGPAVDDVDGFFTMVRAGHVALAENLDALQYFEHLKDDKSEAWQSLMSLLSYIEDIPPAWRDYLETHGF